MGKTLLCALLVVACEPFEEEARAPDVCRAAIGASELSPVPPASDESESRRGPAAFDGIPSDPSTFAVVNPAPIAWRPRSISLGYIGDGKLTPTAAAAPRWPWMQERFQHDPWRSVSRSVGRWR